MDCYTRRAGQSRRKASAPVQHCYLLLCVIRNWWSTAKALNDDLVYFLPKLSIRLHADGRRSSHLVGAVRLLFLHVILKAIQWVEFYPLVGQLWCHL